MINLRHQWAYIEDVAAQRLQHNKTTRHVSTYGDRIEVMGAAGELAARQYFGLPVELGTRFDGGTDFIYRGVRIDVKATQWTSKIQFRFLQWPIWKPLKADAVLLTAINSEDKQAIVVGYATRNEISLAHINLERYDPCHEIPIQDLHLPRTLMPASPKKMRLVDPNFSRMILGRDGLCLYGFLNRLRCTGGLDPHHIKTRGSGGDDTAENGITLCRYHHDLAQSNRISPEELHSILTRLYGYTYQEI